MKKIASEYLYQPGGQAQMRTNWSPDSKWIAYTLGTPTFFRRVHVYSVDQDKILRRHRRPEQRRGADLRRRGQVPLVPGLHRRRPRQPVVRHVERGHAPDLLALPGRPAQGPAQSSGQGERRGEAQGREKGSGQAGGQAGDKPAAPGRPSPRRPSPSTSTGSTTASSPSPSRPASTTTSRPAKAASSSTAR